MPVFQPSLIHVFTTEPQTFSHVYTELLMNSSEIQDISWKLQKSARNNQNLFHRKWSISVGFSLLILVRSFRP